MKRNLFMWGLLVIVGIASFSVAQDVAKQKTPGVLPNLGKLETIFQTDLESSLKNKDYKDLMRFAEFDLKAKVETNFTQLATDTLSRRLELKSKLMNSLTDLEWRLKIPTHEVDGKIVLLRSYLKTMLVYYQQLKDVKTEYDNATKNRVLAMLRILHQKYSHIPTQQRDGYIKEALLANNQFKEIVVEYHNKHSKFKNRAAEVVAYVRAVDLTLNKLKEKRFDIEMSIVAHKMEEQVERILGDVKALNAKETIDQIDRGLEEKATQSSGDVTLTKEAVADFLLNIGI